MNSSKHILAMTLVALLAACSGKEEPQAPAASTETAPAAAPETPAPAQAMAEGPTAEEAAGVDAAALYASRCASCHGMLAEGQNGNPSLLYMSAADIKTKLQGYRDGKQMGPKTAIMAATAKNLKDAEIAALARFLAS